MAEKIKIDGAAKELHYIGIDGAVEVDGDGWAAVPDELLQNSGTILGWAYHIGSVFGSTATKTEAQQEAVSVITDEDLPITKISIYCSGTGTMPAGTKLTLYGVPVNDD